MKQLVDRKLAKFLLVGVVNTLVGMAIMFGLYNLAHCSYSGILCGELYPDQHFKLFLNKYFTFESKASGGSQMIRFSINIAACWLLAYGLAKPACQGLLQGMADNGVDNVSMLVGMCLFTGLNYFGQRLFVFREA